MFGFSYMTTSRHIQRNQSKVESGKDDSAFWIVFGKLRRGLKKQVLRDKINGVGLTDFQTVATLGIGGFGK